MLSVYLYLFVLLCVLCHVFYCSCCIRAYYTDDDDQWIILTYIPSRVICQIQRSIDQTVAFDRVRFSLTNSFSEIAANIAINYILWKVDFNWHYIFVADSMGLSANIYAFGSQRYRIRYTPTAITLFKVIQGHRFWYYSKAHRPMQWHLRLVVIASLFV